jgi:hypothetical protein
MSPRFATKKIAVLTAEVLLMLLLCWSAWRNRWGSLPCLMYLTGVSALISSFADTWTDQPSLLQLTGAQIYTRAREGKLRRSRISRAFGILTLFLLAVLLYRLAMAALR